jgi:type I restriction enzyme S subunit
MSDKNIKPQIRFKRFTEDWEERKLGSLAEIKTGPFGSTLHAADYVQDGEPIITTEHFKSGDLPNNKKGLPQVSSEDFSRLKAYLLRSGDIVFSRVGSIDINAHVKSLQDGWLFSGRVLRVRTTESIDSEYLHHELSTTRVRNSVISRAVGQTMPSINTVILKDTLIQVPSDINEQYKIGTYFNNLDQLITLNQGKYNKLATIKKALLEKMFPKIGTDVPEIRFKGFTEAWELRKVCELFKVTRGNVLAATETSEKQSDNMPYPVYSSQTKNDGLMGYYKEHLFENAITWTTDGANAGTVNYRPGKFYSTNVNGVLLSNDGYANKAIAEALNKVAWKHVSHVGNPKLMNNVMSEISISIPSSVEEQIKISVILDKIDNLITLQMRELEKLKNIKKACLEKMFV